MFKKKNHLPLPPLVHRTVVTFPKLFARWKIFFFYWTRTTALRRATALGGPVFGNVSNETNVLSHKEIILYDNNTVAKQTFNTTLFPHCHTPRHPTTARHRPCCSCTGLFCVIDHNALTLSPCGNINQRLGATIGYYCFASNDTLYNCSTYCNIHTIIILRVIILHYARLLAANSPRSLSIFTHVSINARGLVVLANSVNKTLSTC